MKAGIHICAWIVSHFTLLISEFFFKKTSFKLLFVLSKEICEPQTSPEQSVFLEFKAGKKIHWSMVKPG